VVPRGRCDGFDGGSVAGRRRANVGSIDHVAMLPGHVDTRYPVPTH
jgi:hypothetical protein